MAGMSDFLENKLVDHIFRGVSYTAPSQLHVGLFTGAPNDAGGGTEVPSTNGYVRAQLNPSTTNWAATNSAGSTANPSAGTGGVTSNNSSVTFPTPSGSWGTVSHFGVFDASTGGNLLFHAALADPKAINNGDSVSFAAGALTVTFA
jgi:hypothetical protein